MCNPELLNQAEIMSINEDFILYFKKLVFKMIFHNSLPNEGLEQLVKNMLEMKKIILKNPVLLQNEKKHY